MGFSSLAYRAAIGKKYPDKPGPSYVFTYFPKLIALSLIIFSVLHLPKFDLGLMCLYYPFSAGLGIFLGYNIDSISPKIP
jgi:hypothetical protein